MRDFICTIGGQTARVAPEAMAYSSRDANYVMNVHGRWESAAEDERCIAWAREFFAKSQPFASGGAYVNFLTQEESERIPLAYVPTYKRLVDLKRKHDPTNFFLNEPEHQAAMRARSPRLAVAKSTSRAGLSVPSPETTLTSRAANTASPQG